MRGCLTLPFRLLLLALFIGAGVLAWTYRDEIRRRIHRMTAEPTATAAEGKAEDSNPAAARQKLALLARGRDSVVLTASEIAAFISAEANGRVPRAVDSIRVHLGNDEVEVRGLADTRPLKPGLAAMVLRDREWVETAGRLTYRRSGVAEWEITRVRVRGIPVPRSVVENFLRQLSGSAAPRVVELPLPGQITGLRTGATGVVLYGGRRGS
jgi:hypothetical protein